MPYDLTKLTLRPWHDEDAADLVASYRDPEMATQGSISTEAEAVAWIEWTHGLDNGYVFAVADAADLVVGTMAVTGIDKHGVGWCWYSTVATARGRGVAADALRALSGWAHGEIGLHRLELGHRVNNPGSCRVAEAAGFAVEGLERERLVYDGERFDVERHARLAHDPLDAPRRAVVVRG